MSDTTFGKRAVGLTFNPSGDPAVAKIKEMFAEIIDLCHGERLKNGNPHSEQFRMYSIAITEAQAAQMWAVKAVTWREEE